jgi:hypothetical protein
MINRDLLFILFFLAKSWSVIVDAYNKYEISSELFCNWTQFQFLMIVSMMQSLMK